MKTIPSILFAFIAITAATVAGVACYSCFQSSETVEAQQKSIDGALGKMQGEVNQLRDALREQLQQAVSDQQKNIDSALAKMQGDVTQQWDALKEQLQQAVTAQQKNIDTALGKMQSDVTQQRDALKEQLQAAVTAQQKNIDTALGKMQGDINQQTAVMNRALGKVIPIQMPEDFENRFKALESVVADKDHWPKTLDETQKDMAELVALMKQLPPWAEDDYLPRLNPLRWSLHALLCIRSYATTADAQADDVAETYSGLLSSVPDNAPPDLLASVKEQKDKRIQQSDKWHRERVIAQATAITTGKGDGGDVLTVWQQLAVWENDKVDGEKVKNLRKDLREIAMLAEAKQQAVSTSKQRDGVLSLSSDKLRQQGLARLYEKAVNQRLDLAGEGFSSSELDGVIKTLDEDINAIIRREEAKQADSYRAYQKVALAEIGIFWTAEWYANQDKYAYDKDYKWIRDAMVEHLLRLQPGLLDTPVREQFDYAFHYGWQKLDKREDQTYVAQHAATVEKRRP